MHRAPIGEESVLSAVGIRRSPVDDHRLDIAEAESGAVKLRFTAVDLVGLVRDALELFQPIAEDKHIAPTFAAPEH